MLAHYIDDFMSVVLIKPRKSYALIQKNDSSCFNLTKFLLLGEKMQFLFYILLFENLRQDDTVIGPDFCQNREDGV